ncbi:MAG: triacylglycerol lipase [Actinomycetota bacterium]
MTAKRRLLAVTVAGAVGVLSVTAPARGEPTHQKPQKAARVAFGPGFPALVDHEWGFALGGFGGVTPGAPRTHAPVIFVHGNTVDAADWYVVRDDFRKAGWSDQELWAVSYNGLGGNSGTATQRLQPEMIAEHAAMGWDGEPRVTNNSVNVADVYDFVRAVQTYTGSRRVSFVAHSLGVTVVRKMLKEHPEMRNDVVAFVGIAGGNHGTSLCPPGSEGNVVSCDEIAANTPWLAALNGANGSDETYGVTKWLTISDGSGAADPGFAGPTYATSPQLRGADNRTFPGTYHNDLRVLPAIVSAYRQFVEAADAAAPTTLAAPSTTRAPASALRSAASPVPVTPSTGGQSEAGIAAVLLTVVLTARRARRRAGNTVHV